MEIQQKMDPKAVFHHVRDDDRDWLFLGVRTDMKGAA
jgi:hypothetical protein